MFDRIIALLEQDDTGKAGISYDPLDIASAVAALYFHMINADGVVTMAEIERFRAMLQEQFSLDADALNDVIRRGTIEDRASPGLFPFTAILNRELDAEGKALILQRLGELASADGRIDKLEADMLDHVRNLLRMN